MIYPKLIYVYAFFFWLAAASGFVINTCGWIEDKGRDLIRHCITASGADVVLVVGDEYLYKALSTSINPTSTTTSVATSSSSTTTTTSTTSSSTTSTAKAVKVVNVPRPGGVKARSTSPRRLARTNRYFEKKNLVDFSQRTHFSIVVE